jgi:hypothetical protein
MAEDIPNQNQDQITDQNENIDIKPFIFRFFANLFWSAFISSCLSFVIFLVIFIIFHDLFDLVFVVISGLSTLFFFYVKKAVNKPLRK